MSLIPDRTPPRENPPAEATPAVSVSGDSASLPQPQSGRRKWRHRIWTACFAVFCVEIGAFLAVFPWLDSWHLNHFPTMFPWLMDLWEDPYLRGAVSGLGLVNLIIAASQVNRILSDSSN